MVPMNDPHVKAIHYFIEHDDSVDYSEAKPLAYEEDLFHIQVDKGQVIIEPKNHYPTEEEAKKVVESFMRRWEFEAALRGGSSKFRLIYAGVDIIDRNPPPPPLGVKPIYATTLRSGLPRMQQVRLTKKVVGYPTPPSSRPIDPDDPDASFMLSRLDLYRQRREPLASVAYFCLTVLEGLAVPRVRARKERRERTTNYYCIEEKVLDEVGNLSSEKGGPAARKAEGRMDEFTKEEIRFLEASIAAFIRRVAEKVADPNGKLPEITKQNLSK